MFTGHGGLLGIRQTSKSSPQGPEEEEFLASMERPENLRNYQEKTSDNIKKMFDWVRRIEHALPVAKLRLCVVVPPLGAVSARVDGVTVIAGTGSVQTTIFTGICNSVLALIVTIP